MKIREKKGFLSIDFLFSVVFLLMITANFFSVYEGRYRVARETGRDLHGRMTSNKLAGPINNVYTSDGALSVEMEFSENIFGENYWLGFNREETEVFTTFDNDMSNNPATGASVFDDFVVGMENGISPGKVEVFWEDNIFSLEEETEDIIEDLEEGEVHEDLSDKFNESEKTLPLSESLEVREVNGREWKLEDIGNDYTYLIEEIGETLEVSWYDPKVRVEER